MFCPVAGLQAAGLAWELALFRRPGKEEEEGVVLMCEEAETQQMLWVTLLPQG